MRLLSAEEKLAAVREVIDKKRTLLVVSKKYNCSRQSLYNWIRKYQTSPRKAKQILENSHKRGSTHHNNLPWKTEKVVLDLVVKNPDYSLRRLSREANKLGYKVSHKGVYGILIRHNLTTLSQRHNFSLTHPVKTLFSHEFSPAYRAKAVEEYLEERIPISVVCRSWHISRPTFYKWLKLYKTAHETGNDVVEALVKKHKKGVEHHRTVNTNAQQIVLRLASEKPEYSVHKLHAVVPKAEGKPIVGHHGIQNILERNNLSTYNQRLAYAQGTQVPEQAPVPVEAPVPPRSALIRLLSPFATIPKYASNPIAWPITIPFVIFILYIFEIDKVFRPSVFFPITALTFGLIFFAYSAKYYASLVFVLKEGAKQDRDRFPETSIQASGEDNSPSSVNSLTSTIFKKIFRPKKHSGIGLVEDLSKVKLNSTPFVSVHIPIYNEKRVVERLIKANSALRWQDASGNANYEVIVIDDSNDETTEIAKKVMSEDDRQLVLEIADEQLHVYSSIPPKGSGKPVIKLIHRNSRQGYKGAALAKALENTARQAEYILIFDADFVPYADTIEQFVRYFALVNEKSEEKEKIAAIQGYQWHVLNKSENWVTRGVRSEYAGSYVVERSAIELYGGLKMIAGSVYAIRRDILQKFGWGTSITEDFELTMRLYAQGYKVVYTPYIQAPAEAVATIRRLIRQRMRWAEGHSFNIKKHLKDIVTSPHLTFREKVEFAFLAPYYLQAAFFMAGTFAWFFAEVIIGVNLPFWTAALGWSLVFSNFLALPLVNLLGLFLEQSEEKDYLGVFSFVLLSYLVTPFQAYAAVKGYFEKEEGPWFRTPKTGHVTDVFGRFKIWRWKLGLPFGKGAQVAETPVVSSYTPALASAFNPLQGYQFKPRRISLVSRSVLAVFLVIVMLANYLAFFAEPKSVSASHGGPHLEQEMTIVQDLFTTTSTSYTPTNNSLGLIYWDASKFSDLEDVYFEALLETSNGSQAASALLVDDTGGAVTGAGCTLSSTSTTYERVRTTSDLQDCSGFTSGDEYTVRIKATTTNTARIKGARLVIYQEDIDGGMITDTQTLFNVDNPIGVSSSQTNYGASLFWDWCYDGEIPGSATTDCTAASPSNFDPATSAERFEVTMWADNAGTTVYAKLHDITNSTDASSELTVVGTTPTRVEDTTITLTAGHEYRVFRKIAGTAANATMVTAKVIVEQSDGDGIEALETRKQMIYENSSNTTSTYTKANYENYWDEDQFSGTLAFGFTASIKTNDKGDDDTAFAKGCNDSEGSCSTAVSTQDDAFNQVFRSAWSSLTDDDEIDTYIKCEETDGGCNATVALSVLRILITSMPVPELAIVALPTMFFLPKLIRWFKQKRKSKKKKAGGKGKRRIFLWGGLLVDSRLKMAF